MPLLGIAAVASLVFGVLVTDELYRLLNTVTQFGTVALLVWQQQHIKRNIEPEVKDTAAVVKRKLGERTPETGDTPDRRYNGPDRRKS